MEFQFISIINQIKMGETLTLIYSMQGCCGCSPCPHLISFPSAIQITAISHIMLQTVERIIWVPPKYIQYPALCILNTWFVHKCVNMTYFYSVFFSCQSCFSAPLSHYINWVSWMINVWMCVLENHFANILDHLR